MPYFVYRHEGGLQVKKDGPFDTEEAAQERKKELNEKIDIACGGFQVHEKE